MQEKNIKIMLVEDEAILRDLYEQAFRLKGYHIETAVDGQDAVEKLDKIDKLPALILLDMMMPRMSGFDVLRYINNSGRLKGILVVVLTNLGGEEEAQKALKLGAVSYLVKNNYEPREVVAKAEEILTKYSKQE